MVESSLPPVATVPDVDDRPVVLVYLSLADSGEIRGGSRSMLLTARHLTRYRPVFVLNRDTPFAEEIRAAGIAVHVLPARRWIEGLRAAPWAERLRKLWSILRHDAALLRLAGRLRAEVVHCQDPAEVISVGVAARLGGRPVVFHMRDGPRHPRLRAAKLLAAAVAAKSVCVSEAVRRSYVEAAPPALRSWLARRTVAVPNGVALAEAEPPAPERRAARGSLGVPAGAFALACIGPLTPKKNQLALLDRAAGALLALGPDVHLLLVGSERSDPAYAEACRASAARLAGRERVRFLGELPHAQMASVYAALDALLLPSAVEGLPRVALEAQTVGCPVIGTRIPGNEAAVVDGVTGFLVEPDRLHDLVERAAAVRDPALRSRLSEAARRHIRDSFDVRVVTPRIEAIYDEIRGAARTHPHRPPFPQG